MAVRQVLRVGDPLLQERSVEISEFDDRLHRLIDDMLDTMIAQKGVGLAAPQIGVMKRVVIFGFDSSARYPDAQAVPRTCLINPVITPLEEQTTSDWEGCLSVPGMRGKVDRYTHIRYQGFDIDGTPIDRTAEGFHARVVQHECDHLDGILYVHRLSDPAQFGFTEELASAGRLG